MKPLWKLEVLDIYREADKEVVQAGPVCIASGRCCRFKEFGHTLFLSQMEAEVLLDDCPPFEGPLSSDFCPFQKENLCTARDPRPLGCRVYFCDPNYQTKCQEISEKYIGELKKLAEKHNQEWRYAPLHVFLKEDLANR